MARKKIRVAIWEYRNDDGKRRHAYFGDVVDLSDDEVERGSRAGVFDQPEPPADAAPAEPETPPATTEQKEPAADQPRRPRATATAEKWAAYAKAISIDEDQVDAVAADKDALIALVDAAESAK